MSSRATEPQIRPSSSCRRRSDEHNEKEKQRLEYQKLRPGRPRRTNQDGQRRAVQCRLSTLWPGILEPRDSSDKVSMKKRKEKEDGKPAGRPSLYTWPGGPCEPANLLRRSTPPCNTSVALRRPAEARRLPAELRVLESTSASRIPSAPQRQQAPWSSGPPAAC